jgi:site-specific recombinase XerD
MSQGDRPDYSIYEAIELYLRRKRPQWKGETERSYRKSLETFQEYAAENGITSLEDLDRWTVGNFTDHLLAKDLARATIASKQKNVRTWLKYLEGQGLLDLGLHLAIETIRLDDKEEVSSQKLAPEAARTLLTGYRDDPRYRGKRRHALLELLWHAGPRRSCIRALDVEDYDDGELTFRNRPETGTRLKRGDDHERKIVLSEKPRKALEEYIARSRIQIRDDEGREPLFSSQAGRPTKQTITSWVYEATLPCAVVECPHGRRRPSCSYVPRDQSSKCPSSRSPHPVRRGSITWQRNLGIGIEKVASRAATTPDVIRRYYDQPDLDEALDRRRADTESIDIERHLDQEDLDADEYSQDSDK